MTGRTETAILAGGCAWPMQQLLRHPGGVISTRVGWTGGEGDNPTEEDLRATPRRSRSSSIRSGSPIGSYSSTSSRSTGPTLAKTSSAPSTARRSSIRARSSAGSPRRRSPTSMPRATGSAGPSLEVSAAGRLWEDPPMNEDYLLRFPDYPEGSRPPFPRSG